MKNIKVKLFTLTLVSIFIGCNSDFGDMNVDPNNPSEALPDLLLSSALTSMSEEECKHTYNTSIEEMYDRSIELMNRYNFWGAICSPHDLQYFDKHKSMNLKKICPGIQLQPMDNDQVRTATPQEAIDAGADYLVMGRSFFEEYHEDFHKKH